MMHRSDGEWREYETLWRDAGPAPRVTEFVARRVRRNVRVLWALTGGELALIAAAGAILWPTLRDAASVAETALAAALGLLAIGITSFAAWNRRGSWRADAATPAAYLAWLERRGRARLRTARFVRAVSGLQGALVVALVAVRSRGRPAPADGATIAALVLATAVVVVFLGWAAWTARRARHDLAVTDEARRLLGEADDV